VRAQTLSDHLRLVAKWLGWHAAEEDNWAGWKDVTGVHGRLRDRADVPSVLFRLATEHLFSEGGTDHQAECGVVDRRDRHGL
jgi:hypothetical protein